MVGGLKMFDSKTKTFVVAVAVVTAMILLSAGCFLAPVMAQEGDQAAGITARKIVETNEYDRWEKELAKAKEQYEKSYRMFLAIPPQLWFQKYRAYLKVMRDYTTYKKLEKKYNEWIAKKGSTLDGIVYEAVKGKKRPRGVAKATVSIYRPIMIMRKNVEKADISIMPPPIRKPLYTAVTRKGGKYKITKMKPGRYMMTIEKEGYEKYTLFNFDLKPGRNKAKDYIKKRPVQVATSLSGIVRRAPGFPGYEKLQEDVVAGRESIQKLGVLDPDADEIKVSLKKGWTVEFGLVENPSTGYRWTHTFKPEGIASVVRNWIDSPVYQKDQPEKRIIGAPVTKWWSVRGDTLGETLMYLDYRRSWENNQVRRLTLRITVKKKINILQPLQGAEVTLTVRRPLRQNDQMPPLQVGGLCTRCKDRIVTADIGACSIPDCRGMTSSGSYKLCKSCSARLGQCMACRGALVPVVKPWTISTKTDAEGAFNFPRLFDGKVHLLVTFKGFLPYEETFDIKKGGTYTRNTIILYPVFRDVPVPMFQEKEVDGQDIKPVDSIEDAFDQ